MGAILKNDTLTYETIVAQYGEIIAFQCLLEIEKAAGLRPDMGWGADPEVRLNRALMAQDYAYMCSLAV